MSFAYMGNIQKHAEPPLLHSHDVVPSDTATDGPWKFLIRPEARLQLSLVMLAADLSVICSWSRSRTTGWSRGCYLPCAAAIPDSDAHDRNSRQENLSGVVFDGGKNLRHFRDHYWLRHCLLA